MMRWILIIVCACGLVGCEEDERPKTGNSTKREMAITETNHQKLMKAVPAPRLSDSLERRNLVKFLKYWNNPNRLSYLYLMSRSGTVVGYYTIKGKITYCCSKLTTRDQIVNNGARYTNTYQTHVIESPGLDGSYGPSEDAIFFFTSENPDVPVVWRGDYLVSGVPLKLSTKPILLRTVK